MILIKNCFKNIFLLKQLFIKSRPNGNGVDQLGVDQMGVDQLGVDQLGINRK